MRPFRDFHFLSAAAVIACTLAATPVMGASGSPTTVDQPILASVTALYKDLHRHPELAFAEHRTAKILAKQMRQAGFDVTEGVGGTGVVAILKNGDGPTILVRTDMDGLPVAEATGLPYASKDTAQWQGRSVSVMHACGHDFHMAAWVGTAQMLATHRSLWSGTLMFVAQPAEEITAGARAMLADNLFARFGKPDFGFALHTTNAPAGTIGYRAGPSSSNATGFEIRFIGKGAHGSMPELAIDPVIMAARFVTDLQTVVSREQSLFEPGQITLGAIEAGSAGNIIPAEAIVRGSARSYEAPVQAKLLAGITRTANAVAAMSAAPAPEVDFAEPVKAVVNDAALTARVGTAFKARFADKAIELARPSPAGEDYSEFIDAGVPSLYFVVGVQDPQAFAEAEAEGRSLPVNHSPRFAPVLDPSLETAIDAMVLAVTTTAPPR